MKCTRPRLSTALNFHKADVSYSRAGQPARTGPATGNNVLSHKIRWFFPKSFQVCSLFSTAPSTMTENSSQVLEQGDVLSAAIPTSVPAWGQYQPSSTRRSLWVVISVLHCLPDLQTSSNARLTEKTVLATSSVMKELFFHTDGTPSALLPSKLHSSLYPDVAEWLCLGPAG